MKYWSIYAGCKAEFVSYLHRFWCPTWCLAYPSHSWLVDRQTIQACWHLCVSVNKILLKNVRTTYLGRLLPISKIPFCNTSSVTLCERKISTRHSTILNYWPFLFPSDPLLATVQWSSPAVTSILLTRTWGKTETLSSVRWTLHLKKSARWCLCYLNSPIIKKDYCSHCHCVK